MNTEESFLDFRCPHCGETVSFPSHRAGLAEVCPLCFESFIVPKVGDTMGRVIPFPLSTPRLILRRLRERDLPDLVELYADEEDSGEQEIDAQERKATEEERIIRWLQRDVQVKLTTPDQPFCLGIELQEGGKLIGCLELRFNGVDRLQGSIFVTVNRKHQRQGLASEAVAGLLDFCFETISMHRVTAACNSGDVGTVRMLEKVGMRREGVFLKDRRQLDEWLDTAYYALLGEEYQASISDPTDPKQPPA
jgi:RimJ/RimL family protein N-acetyltransferase